MKTSSAFVIVIPLVVVACVLAVVLYMRSLSNLSAPAVPTTTSDAVPALNAQTGKPQSGFAVDELTANSVSDLTQQLDSVSEDTAADDFDALKSDAATL